ncbi:MAG: SCPU domain-containing protein [Sphingobium sp.]|nr:SCPU domain-containing protein [Sphingobium sp.]
MKRVIQHSAGLSGRAGGVCLALLACIGTSAAEVTASFQVSAQIVDGCEINQTIPANGAAIGKIGTLNFGSHPSLTTGPISTTLSYDMGFRISCTPSVTLSMSLDGGQNATSSRRLQSSSGTAHVDYHLYRDAGFGQELAINQPYEISFIGGEAITLPIYGRLTLSGSDSPDTYTDSVRITLAW